MARFTQQNHNDYQLLGLPEDASWLEIRTAYREMLRIWHPDRFAQDDPLKKKAEARTKELNLAYENLRFMRQCPDFLLTEENKRCASLTAADCGQNFEQQREYPESSSYPGGRVSKCSAVKKIAQIAAVCAIGFQIFSVGLPGRIAKLIEGTTALRPAAYRSITDQHYRTIKPALKEAVQSPEHLQAINSTLVIEKPALVESAIACNLNRTKALVRDGASVDAEDSRGDTALSWAAKTNCLAVAEFLLAQGADPIYPSHNGWTPIEWAKSYRHLAMEQRLRSAASQSVAHAEPHPAKRLALTFGSRAVI